MRKLEFAVLALILSTALGRSPMAATFPGPDEFGYLARAIEFDLRDVSVSGTALALDDDDVIFVPLPDGFEFNFYGATYQGIAVSSNGFIAFSTRLNDGCCEGKPLPNLNFNQIPFTNIVAGFWEDLNSAPGQIPVQVHGAVPTRQFVIGYYGVEHFQTGEVTTGEVTFEIILHEGSNQIEL